MHPKDESTTTAEQPWACDVKVKPLTDAQRAYDSYGLHLVTTVVIDGKEVEVPLHLSPRDALDLATILTAQVNAEWKRWPNGYSDAERAEWRRPVDAQNAADAEATADEVARQIEARATRRGGQPSRDPSNGDQPA